MARYSSRQALISHSSNSRELMFLSMCLRRQCSSTVASPAQPTRRCHAVVGETYCRSRTCTRTCTCEHTFSTVQQAWHERPSSYDGNSLLLAAVFVVALDDRRPDASSRGLSLSPSHQLVSILIISSLARRRSFPPLSRISQWRCEKVWEERR